LAHSCAGDLAAHAGARQVSLSVEGTPARVNADPDRLRQVLVNLLDNAIRYSPPGEAVTITVKPAKDTPNTVAVSVQDRGPGIPPQEQARVFERFYRADKSRARAGDSGAGLGLAIAQTLVEAHGGRITLDSSPGHGTIMSFTLPGE
jgi:signal transduction histidine kinase